MPTEITPYMKPASLHRGSRRDHLEGLLNAYGVAELLDIEVDADGSPVTLPEAEWLICFVPGLRQQWWHRFAHARHKHVFAIRRLENGSWLLVEPWWTRLMVNVLTFEQALKFLRWGDSGHILKVRESIPGRGTQMRGWSNCAVLMAFLLGRSYWTWTPDGLYRRLVADAGVQSVDLLPLLVEHYRSIAEQVVDDLSNAHVRDATHSLHDALLDHGIGLMRALASSSAHELRDAVIHDSELVRDASDGCWCFVITRAIASTLEVIEGAQRHGGVDGRNFASEAQLFVMKLISRQLPRGPSDLRPAENTEVLRHHVAAVLEDILPYDTDYADMRPDSRQPAGSTALARNSLACS